jgi:sulfur relay (sulfurtransferase) complex TusBCD TusD component (DsrE family)
MRATKFAGLEESPMGGYLLIASEDPFERRDTDRCNELAVQLAQRGHEVTVFLIQNAVLCARATCARTGLRALMSASVSVLADELSLRERGIGKAHLMNGVRAAPLDVVIERLGAGCKTLWS